MRLVRKIIFSLTSLPIFTSSVYAQDLGVEAGPLQLINLILRIINIAVGLAFMAMTVMFVVAGFKFITSEGDQKKLASARLTMTWAVLGIFFMGIGWLILLLIQRFTGVNVTNFCIGFRGVPFSCN